MKLFLVVKSENNNSSENYFMLNNNNNFHQNASSQESTYTVVLHNLVDEHINKEKHNNYKQVLLDKKNTISIKNQDFDTLLNQYNSYKNYCLFSPFHVLLENMKFNKIANSINILYYDSNLYILILDKKNKIIYTNKTILSNFYYTDNSLYTKKTPEVFELELTNIIKDNIELFYKQEDSFFIGIIQVFNCNYTINNELLLIDSIFKQIDIDESLLRLTQKELNYHRFSYTPIDETKIIEPKQDRTLLLSFIYTSTFILFIYFLFLSNSTKDRKIQDKITKSHKLFNILKIKNYTTNNNQIVSNIKDILNNIPNNEYLSNAMFMSNELTLKVKSLDKKIVLKDILENYYKISNLTEQTYDNNEYISTIQSRDLIDTNFDIPIKNYKLLLSVDLYAKFKKFLPKKAKVLYQDNIYKITLVISSPKEFYNFIQQLNSLNLPIELLYPIRFKSTDNKLAVLFSIKDHQND